MARRNTLTCILFYFSAISFGLGEVSENERLDNLTIDDAEVSHNPNVSGDDPTTLNLNPAPTEQDETVENNSNPFLGVFPDDVKEQLAIAKKNLLLAPLILLRPLAVKAANFFNYWSHPNVAWTPAHFFQKVKDKFENLATLISQSAFGSGLYHNADYPFPYRHVQSKK